MGQVNEIDLGPQGGPLPVSHVLVVDDSRLQRRILAASLTRWGYRVTEAESGADALKICADTPPDIVLSDWMMPGMDGLEFCQAFRAMPRDRYGYFILLTSKTEKDAVARGLDCGADDFLNKPVNAAELRARINAGERIQRMEKELVEKNGLITTTLQQLQMLYDALDSDLIEAKKLQQSLVRERFYDFDQGQVSLLLRSSGHVGGDLVGVFPVCDGRIGLFGIDVSGHGISSALMTARLAGYLSATPDHNVALARQPDGTYAMLPPATVAAELNRLVLEDMETEHYFTLLLADVDLTTGHMRMVQAGHPHPVVQRADGKLETLGSGGLPVGLIAGASYEEFDLTLNKGDRLLIQSDGVNECPDPDGVQLDDEGLMDLLKDLSYVHGTALLETLVWKLADYAGGEDFPDDVSAILFEYCGDSTQ
ncbi:MAG: PP2C family protein-serine/threonine phosphatase [Paracoccaceae bacterium]